MKRFSVLLLLALPLLVFGSDKKFEKTFSVDPGGTLRVMTDFGDVSITGTAGSEVSVVAVLKGSVKDIDDFDITATQSGTVVEVRGKGRDRSWWSMGFDDLSIQYTIRVPDRFTVDVTTAGGDILVEQLQGGVKSETSGGDVTLKSVSGDARLETSGGNVMIADLSGGVRAETSGGNIDVARARGDVHVETSGGDIRIKDVDGAVYAETSGGDIVVALSGENKGVVASTSGGDIDILTAETIRANLDASTSGGSVVCRLPVTLSGEIDESHVQGTINGGGEVIRARTSGGDVTIKKPE